MSRIFSDLPDMTSRVMRKTPAAGDPEGWQALSEGYQQLSRSIGSSVKINVMTESRVPGTSFYDPRNGEIYVDSDLLGVNPYDFDMNIKSQQTALIEFHGLFLHDLAHARFTDWTANFDEAKAILASSLEDIRVEYRLVSERENARQWLRAALAIRLEFALSETRDGSMRTVVLTLETIGRAMLGLVLVKDVADVLAKVSDLLDDRALSIIHDVVLDLKVTRDDDKAGMVNLVERLWSVVEPPLESDQEDPDEEEFDQDSDSEDESKESEDSSNEESEEGDEKSEDGAPSDADSGEEPGDQESDSDSEGDSNGEGDGEPGEGEGDGEPGEGSSEGSSKPGELSPSDTTSMTSKIRNSSDQAAQEIREEQLEELIEMAEAAIGKDLVDDISDPSNQDPQDGDGDQSDGDDGEEEEPAEVSHGHSSGGRRIKVTDRKPTTSEFGLRRRLGDRLRKAQWRDREIVKYASEVPPGRLNTREAIRGEVQKQRGQMITAKPWKARRHRTIETRKVRVAVLIDASGSMGPYIEDFSSAAWTTISAVRDVGGKSIGVAFGDTAEIIDARSGHARTNVPTYPANGGMEAISQALDISIKELDLYDEEGATGPRLIVIFSDGYWTDEQTQAADFKLEKLRKSGVGVVVVAAGSFVESHPHDELMTLQSSADFNHSLGDIMVRAVKSA